MFCCELGGYPEVRENHQYDHLGGFLEATIFAAAAAGVAVAVAVGLGVAVSSGVAAGGAVGVGVSVVMEIVSNAT